MIEYTFYDIEATGVRRRHDQISQFAGLTCDSSFGIKDSISQFIRLLPYVVPHPKALEVTRKKAGDLADPALPSEYVAAKSVHKFLNPAPGVTRVFVTFNGIRYDDEMLRTMFFRNMLNPYFNTGRDSVKIDLLTLVQFVNAAAPGTVTVPRDEDGKPSFRLERLCPANGIAIDAHDAYHDSVATMELFRLVKARAPWAVDIAMRCGRTADVEKFVAKAKETGEPVFLFTHFGKPDFVPLALVASDTMKRTIGIDLRSAEVPAVAGKISDLLYKPDSPFQIVTSNKFPMLLSEADIAGLGQHALPESLRQRARDINSYNGLRDACIDAMSLNKVEKVNDPTSEELIYGSFLKDGDYRQMSVFNRAGTWLEKAQVDFSDRRLRDFSARIVLEGIKSGEAVLPHDVISRLAVDCAEALTRPFKATNDRYNTISEGLSTGDAEWADWARETYGDHPVFDAAPVPPPPPGQLAFGF